MREPLLQAFPFPSTLGEVTLHPLSQACTFIYSSRGKWVFSPLLWSFPPTAAFTSFPAPHCWAVLLLLSAAVFVYSSCGWWVFPHSCGVFLPPPLSQTFPLLVAGHVPPLPPEPLQPVPPACLFTVLGRIPLPCSSALSAPHPLCNMSLLFLMFITQFLFFPQVEVGLSSGLCCSGPGLSVGVSHTAKLTLSTSSQAVWTWVTGGWPRGPPGFSV
jgi:hypothetical protein